MRIARVWLVVWSGAKSMKSSSLCWASLTSLVWTDDITNLCMFRFQDCGMGNALFLQHGMFTTLHAVVLLEYGGIMISLALDVRELPGT